MPLLLLQTLTWRWLAGLFAPQLSSNKKERGWCSLPLHCSFDSGHMARPMDMVVLLLGWKLQAS